MISVLTLRRRLAGWRQPKVFAVHHNMCLDAVNTGVRVCVRVHVCARAQMCITRACWIKGIQSFAEAPPSAPFFCIGWCLCVLCLALVVNETAGGACRFDTPLLMWSGPSPLVLGPGGPGRAAVGCSPHAPPERC